MAWAYCNRARTDGFIKHSRWQQMSTRLGRRLMIEQGFAEPVPGGYQMHDYLGHQRSRAEIEQASSHGRRAAQSRWSGDAPGNAPGNAPGMVPGHAPSNAVSINDRYAPSNAEVEVEVDQGSRSVLQVPEADAPETDRPTDDLASIVQTSVHLSTGGSIDRDAAAALAKLILGDRKLSDPAAYLRKALREDGSRWLRDGQAPEQTQGKRAGDRPPRARDLCRRCGGKHPTAQCPNTGSEGEDHPQRRLEAAQAQPRDGPMAYQATKPPPPEVAERGAALAKSMLDAKLAQMREPQPGQAAEDDEQPPF